MKIAAVKEEIEQALHPAGFSKDGWASIRRAAIIRRFRHSCTHAEAQRLWIAAALRRSMPQNQRLKPKRVREVLQECDGDLTKAIPGFIPIAPGVEALPASVLGRQIPEIFYQWVGYRPNDNRLRAWCRKLGLTYSRNGIYSGSELHALLHLWRSMRIAERERSRRLARENFQHS